MRERPILFSAPMILALLDGRKTVTRRLVTHRHPISFIGGKGERDDPACWGYFFDGPDHNGYAVLAGGLNERHNHGRISIPCPFGVAGDRLWVQEAHSIMLPGGDWARVTTLADGETRSIEVSHETLEALRPQVSVQKNRGRPARFMSRWASRILLNVVSERVERLCDITEEDAVREGVRPFFETFSMYGRDQCLTTGERAADAEHRAAFAVLWDELNGDRATWKDNPWVRRIEFRRIEQEARHVA